MAKLNKNDITTRILNTGIQLSCTKLQMDNVIFPKWSDLGIMGLMFRQCVVTKEQPAGNIYDEAKFQTVLRIVGGNVLMSGKTDSYCWKIEKVLKSENHRVIGTNSAEGIVNLSGLLASVACDSEKLMLADMFANLKKDLLLVTSLAEDRLCIEVTREMYDAGITACVDEWMDVDENGMAEATALQIGDYLIVSDSGVYRIGREEFLATHVLK